MDEQYLDNSATTKPMAEAVAACVAAMETEYGNPSSLHAKGFAAEQLLTQAQARLAAALSCDKSELVFTSGATESNNLAMLGGAAAYQRRGKKIIVTAIEHPSVMEAAAELEKQGFTVLRLPPDETGNYTPAQFYDRVDKETILVSAMQVNNETGLILPVEEIAKAVKRKNPDTLMHVDGVQGFLKYPIKLKTAQIDYMSISGHKVYAPKGVGALYIRRGVRVLPRLYGGGQQNGIRSGTEPIPLIAAFGAAVEAQKDSIAQMAAHYQALNCYLREQVSAIPAISIHSGENCAAHIISLAVKGIRSEVMLHFLEQSGIYVSSGSACSKGKHSYVLSALGIGKETADETLRISFGRDTTTQILDCLVKQLNEGIQTLAKKR